MLPELGIAWVPASSSTVVRLRAIAPPRSTVMPFHNEMELLEALSRGGIALTVVEAGGTTHDLAVRALRRVHEAFPQHPLIAWCDFDKIESHQLLDVARAGVQDIIRREFDELRYAFARIIASATQRAVSFQIAAALQDTVPKSLCPVFEYALEHADERLEREAIAAVFGVSRRTLHDRLIAHGFPPTRGFLTWCRLLVASALLDQPGHTLDSVAGQLDYPDGGVLGNSLRRYAGAGINRLRHGGALEATVAAFRESVAAASANLHRDSLPAPSSAD
ncbi:MAG: helix-turn-helix transcriptional regulator [Gemmatimonadaceae bacterium]|nr:helix-turn-helix transcriptional regulator [Gemmatimonadaceae bacterium]